MDGRTTTTRSASTVPRSKPLLNGSAAATRIPPSLQAKMAALASKSQQASTSHANLNGNNATNGIDATVSALMRATLNDRPSLNPNGSPALSTPGLGATGMAGRMPMGGMAARRAKPGLKLSEMQGFGSTPQAFGLRAGRPASPGPASRRAPPQGDLGTPFASFSKIV
jgi:mitogen-activated protein kinase kinase